MLGAEGFLDFEEKRLAGSPQKESWSKGDDTFLSFYNDSGWRGSRGAEKKAVTK
jgi:hypothetical protein